MKLRTRLILAFLLLSVVPLGAVTIYSYVNNVATLEEAAAREADLLASELSARMQFITAELSSRVGQLMDMPAPAAAPKPKPVNVQPAKPAASPAPVTMETQVASALGEAAMLLNSVELQGQRNPYGFGRGQRPGAQASTAGAAQSTSVDRSSAPTPPTGTPRPPRIGQFPTRGGRGSGNRPAGPPPAGGTQTTPPAAGAPGAPTQVPATPIRPVAPGISPAPATTRTTPAAPGTPPVSSAAPAAPGAQAAPVSADSDRIVIDMAAIRRDIVNKMVPEGSTANMTPEARQQLGREMSMRLMGITEGLKLGAAELQKKADEAKKKAAEDAKKVEAKHVEEGAPGPTQTKSALKGNQLGVTVSRNGQVVHTVNAEINLDNVLMTVFSTTRRDRGEVPFAVAKDGKIYTAVVADQAVVKQFGPAIKPNTPVGQTTLPDWIIVTTNDPSGSGLRFGIARPVGDSLSDLRKRAGRNAGLGLVLIAIALVGVVPLSSRLTRNLSTLTDGVERIAQGDYTARVEVKSGDEIGVLAAAFNQMAADVETHQRSLIGQERLKRELELGRQIQNEMLPQEPLRLGLTEVKGVSVPAREVGGDFFNYFPLPTGEVALLVGDVSGKGVGAALVMANIQATLRTRLALEQDLPVITDAIDRDMEAGSRAAYATLFVGIFNPITMRLRYVNAGHHPQFVLRVNGALDRMPSTGTPIGLLSGRGYTQGVVQVATGDFVFFYTDGLVEAENEVGEFFGSERLEAVLHEAHLAAGGAGIDDVLQRVERAIADFRGAREPFDDATMMAVKI